MSEYNSERAKEKLMKKIRQDKRIIRRKHRRQVFQCAAVGLLLLGLGLGYYKMRAPKDDVDQISNYEDSITLHLADGTVKAISEEKSNSIVDKNGYRVELQKGGELIYPEATTTRELVYNRLKVPFGKRFVLVLADGTKVHLNSGTTLKYPVQFKYGKNREVFLRGEGYFEVAKDREHPFVVNTEALNIRVLGTEFDLSAYPDDKNISTVLVEGSVAFFEKDEHFNPKKNQRLKPGHIAYWKKEKGEMTIGKTDTGLYTGWMDGQLIFNHMPFRDICKKLERNYNVTIINDYTELEKIQFTASFDTETIGQVLRAFSKNHPMRYSVDGHNIHIEKP